MAIKHCNQKLIKEVLALSAARSIKTKSCLNKHPGSRIDGFDPSLNRFNRSRRSVYLSQFGAERSEEGGSDFMSCFKSST